MLQCARVKRRTRLIILYKGRKLIKTKTPARLAALLLLCLAAPLFAASELDDALGSALMKGDNVAVRQLIGRGLA